MQGAKNSIEYILKKNKERDGGKMQDKIIDQ